MYIYFRLAYTILLYDYQLDVTKQYKKDHEDKEAYNKSNNLKIYSMYIIYTSINLVIVSGVNAAYVYIALSQSKSIVSYYKSFYQSLKWFGIIRYHLKWYVLLLITYQY